MTEAEKRKRRRYFEEVCERITSRRGDRVLAERLLRVVRLHMEITHPLKTLEEIRRTAPADYDLYREALG